jgi:hypothetical protein
MFVLKVDLYSEYAPHKLETVDELLMRYRGREKQLLKDLNAKYKHTGKRFQPSGKLSQNQLQGIGSAEPVSVNSPKGKVSLMEKIVFGPVKAAAGSGSSTDDFDLKVGQGVDGAPQMPKPTSRGRGRRGTSENPKNTDGPTDEKVDFEIKVKCLDTGMYDLVCGCCH